MTEKAMGLDLYKAASGNELLRELRLSVEREEKRVFHPKAAFSSDHHCPLGPEEDHRLPYKRDVDRILHSKAYCRYVDKTQVVYLIRNDHITHRSLHVQLVSSFSRGIAEILRLNLDLVEAIALGHDVGHPPFGHEGEGYLSELSVEFGCGRYVHPWQSCRLFKLIEPLNLGLNVYDGFLCHDGGMKSSLLQPRFGKTWSDHESDLLQKMEDSDVDINPGTLEGCLVKLCDTISYLGRDLEDAITLGIINRQEVPKTHLGSSNREILAAVAVDIIQSSFGRDYIAISEEVLDALKAIRSFNFERIYMHPKLKIESKKIKRSYRVLMELLLEDYHKNETNSYLWNHFLSNKPESYLNDQTDVRMVIDYIAGMTDHYFVETLEKLFVPKQISLS